MLASANFQISLNCESLSVKNSSLVLKAWTLIFWKWIWALAFLSLHWSTHWSTHGSHVTLGLPPPTFQPFLNVLKQHISPPVILSLFVSCEKQVCVVVLKWVGFVAFDAEKLSQWTHPQWRGRQLQLEKEQQRNILFFNETAIYSSLKLLDMQHVKKGYCSGPDSRPEWIRSLSLVILCRGGTVSIYLTDLKHPHCTSSKRKEWRVNG